MTALRSRDNPKVRRWSRLARDGRFRRQEGCALIEGPHLLAAALEKQLNLSALLVVEDELSNREIRKLIEKTAASPIILSARLFRAIVDAENPPGIAAEITIPRRPVDERADCVFLEGVQDAGNVGTIIRSAAAFGVETLYLARGCADAWSPKVLRAGMGGHFALSIRESQNFHGKLVCAMPRGGTPLKDADLSGPLCWAFGSEGGGVSRELQARAAMHVTIPTAPGTESLNVAAAAAVCFFEAFSRRAGGS